VAEGGLGGTLKEKKNGGGEGENGRWEQEEEGWEIYPSAFF